MSNYYYNDYISVDELLPQHLHHAHHRFLQDTPPPTRPPTETTRRDPRAGSKDGTIAILVVVCLLFCCVWLPGVCRRRCMNNHNNNRHPSRETIANIVRQSLEIQRRARESGGTTIENSHHIGVFMERRRAAVEEMLITKHVVIDDKQSLMNSSSSDDKATTTTSAMIHDKGDLLISSPPPPLTEESCSLDDDKKDQCAICLNDYAEHDEICWSQSPNCYHVFHRPCILEWLLRHDECPCCRNDFLPGLDDDLRMTSNNSGGGATLQQRQPNDHDDLIQALQQLHRQFPHGSVPPAMQAEILRSLFDLYFPRVMTTTNTTNMDGEEDTFMRRRYESGFYMDDGVALEVNDDDENEQQRNEIVVLGDQDIALDSDEQQLEAIAITNDDDDDEAEGDIEMGSRQQPSNVPEAESTPDNVILEEEDIALDDIDRREHATSTFEDEIDIEAGQQQQQQDAVESESNLEAGAERPPGYDNSDARRNGVNEPTDVLLDDEDPQEQEDNLLGEERIVADGGNAEPPAPSIQPEESV